MRLTRAVIVITCASAYLIPQAAHAEPTQWADHRASIPAGEQRQLEATGELAFRTLSPTGRLLAREECEVAAGETFSNKAEHGQGSITWIQLSGCAVHAAGLPWPTMLEASPTFYLNELRQAAFVVGGYGPFTGTLTPKIGDVDDVNNWQDDDDDHLVFQTDQHKSVLTDTRGDTTTITGRLTIEGQRIQAWRFPGPPESPISSTMGLTRSPFGERESAGH